MTQIEYHICFPQQANNIVENYVTFSIGNMKCREYAVVYFILHGYDAHGNELSPIGEKAIYTSERWVINSEYNQYVEQFYVSDDILDDLATIKIEMVAIGVDDDNPLYMTQIMLTDELFTTYHAPNEQLAESDIELIRTCYANLYSNNFQGFLQVIRPSGYGFTTSTLLENDVTVLAPHLDNEDAIDSPTNLLYEFLNQVEQETTIAIDNFTM